jgi:uncharacterized RDD family membrane protein YckC
MQWYYAVGDQRQGPVDQAEFDRLVSSGTIQSGTLVWRQGMAAWQAYSTVVGGTTAIPFADDGTEVCAVSGKRCPRREMINYEGKWISLQHRDEYFQRRREGVALPGESAVPGPFGYGGFSRRFAARFVDGVIQIIPALLIGMLVGMLFRTSGLLRPGPSYQGAFLAMQAITQVAVIGCAIAYEVFFLRKFDATPGKMALGLKIFRPDGAKLSIGRIVGRYFATFISALPLLLGYIVAAFDDERRTFHDRIADTRVINTR